MSANGGLGFGRRTFYQGPQGDLNRPSQNANEQDPLKKKADFHKPRAGVTNKTSSCDPESIKIEVHNNENVMNHLQPTQHENMNLMFYDFNGTTQRQTALNRA